MAISCPHSLSMSPFILHLTAQRSSCHSGSDSGLGYTTVPKMAQAEKREYSSTSPWYPPLSPSARTGLLYDTLILYMRKQMAHGLFPL